MSTVSYYYKIFLKFSQYLGVKFIKIYNVWLIVNYL